MDFKGVRENLLKLSPEQFAEEYEVDVAIVYEWDKNDVTSAPDITIIQKISEKTGKDFNFIMGYKKPEIKPLKVANTWEKSDFTKNTLAGYIKDCLDKVDITEEHKKNYIDDIKNGIDLNLVKPTVSIVGRSDAGKSTLINSLIGKEKMPVSWTPTTSIAVYIKHVNDRPSFINEEVWIFADTVGSENIWNVKRLNDEEYCRKWQIASGGVEMLGSFGTRQGNEYEKHAGSAVVFLEADVLLNCDIVDLPGFGTDDKRDDDITSNVAKDMDILIYLCQADNFMQAPDIDYLKKNVENLPVREKKGENELKPLSNLFIVASQAHNVENGNKEQLNYILKKGYNRFNKSIVPEYWKKREEISGYDDLGKRMAKRFFTYTKDIPSLCEKFQEEFKLILEQLPNVINERNKSFIRHFVSDRKPTLKAEISKYEGVVAKRETYVSLHRNIKDNELRRRDDIDRRREEIKGLIEKLKEESFQEFNDYYLSTVNIDAIAEKIEEKEIKNRKEDIECFASQMLDEIKYKTTGILEEKAKILSSKVQEYIKKYNEHINISFENASVEADFDVGFIFAHALAGVGVLGGLGVLLAEQLMWRFGGLAFIMGMGGDIVLGAAAFGPIGVAVGIAITLGIGIVKLFGGGWQKNVAKKLVKSYEKNEVEQKYKDAIKKYWEDSKNAFDVASSKLDEEWENYVKSLEETVNEYDVEKIKNNIVSLENVMNFFENIPL